MIIIEIFLKKVCIFICIFLFIFVFIYKYFQPELFTFLETRVKCENSIVDTEAECIYDKENIEECTNTIIEFCNKKRKYIETILLINRVNKWKKTKLCRQKEIQRRQLVKTVLLQQLKKKIK